MVGQGGQATDKPFLAKCGGVAVAVDFHPTLDAFDTARREDFESYLLLQLQVVLGWVLEFH